MRVCPKKKKKKPKWSFNQFETVYTEQTLFKQMRLELYVYK